MTTQGFAARPAIADYGRSPVEEKQPAARIKLSVLIPVYNEAPYIEKVLQAVRAVKLPEGLDTEIICVDDGSLDGTSETLDRYKDQITVHHSVLNFGKGTAVRIGIRLAKGDVTLIQDADLEYDPNEYWKLIRPIVAGEADVVYGSRFLGRIENMRFANWLANRLLSATVLLLYGRRITDEATCYKAFRTDVLKSLALRCDRFEFCPEVTAKLCKKGYRIVEVPISYYGRTTNEGKKIRWTDGITAFWTLLRYRFFN
jgi:glycosyltransferase involved in cell wall biosynthesis